MPHRVTPFLMAVAVSLVLTDELVLANVFLMPSEVTIDRIFVAVADPRRRALFDRIARSDGISVAELTAGSGVTQGAVSQHLKVLREAGLVLGQPSGRSVRYRLRPEGLRPFIDWLGSYEEFWPQRVAAMRDLLKEIEE